MPVVRVPFDQLLQHERDRRERGDECDPARLAAGFTAPERSERRRDEGKADESDAERDRKRRILEVAVPARGEQLRPLVPSGTAAR